MTQPIAGLEATADASRARADGSVFLASSFYGKNNVPLEQYDQNGNLNDTDTSTWTPSLAWRPTKIRATFSGVNSVHLLVQDFMGVTIAEATNATSGQELDISYVGDTSHSYLATVTLNSPGTGYSINNFNDFTLTSLEMYGDDPSQYYLVGDYIPPSPQL